MLPTHMGATLQEIKDHFLLQFYSYLKQYDMEQESSYQLK